MLPTKRSISYIFISGRQPSCFSSRVKSKRFVYIDGIRHSSWKQICMLSRLHVVVQFVEISMHLRRRKLLNDYLSRISLIFKDTICIICQWVYDSQLLPPSLHRALKQLRQELELLQKLYCITISYKRRKKKLLSFIEYNSTLMQLRAKILSTLTVFYYKYL